MASAGGGAGGPGGHIKLTDRTDSSMITGDGYHPETKTLAIRYRSGDVVHYDGVSLEQYESFQNSASKGTWVHKHLRTAVGRHPFRKV